MIDLLRETANGVGTLVSLHLRLARRELTGELKAMGGQAATLGSLAGLLLVGYALVMVGVAVIMGRLVPLATSFLMLGSGHVLLAGAAFAWTMRRKPAPVLGLTGVEAKKSLEALTHGH